MNLRALIWGSEKENKVARDKGHLMTIRQIEEAKAAVAEVSLLKDQLVARANGALYQLKAGGLKNGTGESKA